MKQKIQKNFKSISRICFKFIKILKNTSKIQAVIFQSCLHKKILIPLNFASGSGI